jgi:AraC-like DNA-binding protein
MADLFANENNGEDAAATERLLAAVEELSAVTNRGDRAQEENRRIREFGELFGEWVVFHRNVPGDPLVRRQKRRLLLHCLCAAGTLGEAVEFLAEFDGVIYDGRSVIELKDAGAWLEIGFDEPFKPGVTGLMNDIWPLSLALREFEFLVGGELPGAMVKLRHEQGVSANAAALFFDRPLVYGTSDLALLIPRRDLARAIVARPRDIPDFLDRLFPSVMDRAARAPKIRSLVAGLLRNDKLRISNEAATLESVSARLGCGAATVRRRLRAEGTGFREIRDEVFDELSKMWLSELDLSLHIIADRLGYSDVFAFRRAFKRCNGYSPSAYRRQVASALASLERRPGRSAARPSATPQAGS